MMNGFFMEYNTLKAVSAPANMAVAVTGERISLEKNESIAVVLNLGDSAATTIVTLNFHQATANIGGTSAALALDNPWYYQVTAATTAAEGVFTKVEVTAAATTVDLATYFASEPGIAVFEVNADDLTDGYTHFFITTAASSNAKIMGATYVCNKPKFLPPYAESN